jgi:low temperature requirement protein LtrA
MTIPGPGTASPGPDRNPGPASPESSPPGPADPVDPGTASSESSPPGPADPMDPGTASPESSPPGPADPMDPGPASPESSPPGPADPMDPGPVDPDAPLRVTTLELFFDLVFAFTLTQLAFLLVHRLSPSGALEVLLVFGVLWWMYGGYAWLTNTRAPVRTPDRLLLLVGMAGFLICGLAIPRGFGPGYTETRVALGVGYLIVVGVHSALFYRVNRNIVRVTPFNVSAALLVIGAAFVPSPASYLLWAAAVAVQWLSPLIIHPGGRFNISPAHFAERHGALVIVALGESVAAVAIGAAPAGVTFAVVLSAVLGLAVSAALWWTYFGDGDDERAEQAMAATAPGRRAGLALAIYYAHIPILLGVVALAAGTAVTIGSAAQPHPISQALAVAGGAALFLAGSAWLRWALQIGPVALRLTGAGFALATAALGVAVSAEVQGAVLLAGIVAMLAAERRASARAGGEAAS